MADGQPGPVLATVLAGPQFAAMRASFIPAITRTLTLLPDGMTARADQPDTQPRRRPPER